MTTPSHRRAPRSTAGGLARRWRRLTARPEAGDTAISAVILWPVILLLIWLIVQASMFYLGRQLVLSAAEQGAQSARYQPASARRGQAAATEFLTTASSGLITSPHIEATLSATAVRVQVTAIAVSLVPGLALTIHQESVQPIEKLPDTP